MKLVTRNVFAERLAYILAKPHVGEIVWKGRILSDATYPALLEIAKQVADAEEVLHVRRPGPKTEHYVGRPDITANGKPCVEIC
jgi:hypothetical protein|tara:strand:+ start:883 stop:1134 length:252 start_codon:yes stop_codon:yes gene_type:complete